MTRPWYRLVTLFTLAVYLLANTQLSVAAEHWLVRLGKNHRSVEIPSQPAAPTKKCKRCACHAEVVQTAPVTSEKEPSDDSSCPCCPKEKPGCPCPGGCALCNGAKVPLLASQVFDLHPSACVDACVIIEACDYLSPFHGCLDRPPRA